MKAFAIALLAAAMHAEATIPKAPPQQLPREYGRAYDLRPKPVDCTLKKTGDSYQLPTGTLADLLEPGTEYELRSQSSSDWGYQDIHVIVDQKFYVSKNKWKTPYWTYRLFSTNNHVWGVFYATASGCQALFIDTQNKGFDRDVTGQTLMYTDVPAWVFERPGQETFK
jgi:hypothetical protein